MCLIKIAGRMFESLTGKKDMHVHPIDSLYTVESVKDTVPVIDHIFGTKYVR